MHGTTEHLDYVISRDAQALDAIDFTHAQLADTLEPLIDAALVGRGRAVRVAPHFDVHAERVNEFQI